MPGGVLAVTLTVLVRNVVLASATVTVKVYAPDTLALADTALRLGEPEILVPAGATQV
jgi:hypothetical protein